MKLKLENAVRQGQLGSRSRTTKKMNTATTPEYEPTALNGIIIKNFINHLSTTKSNIESTIPNPNQFYTTPSSEGDDIEPLVIMNSNTFFPANEVNVNNYHSNGGINNAEQDDESAPIIVNSSADFNNYPVQNQNAIRNPNTQHPPNYTKYPQATPLPITSTAMPILHNPTQIPPNRQKVRISNKKGSQPTSKPLKTPTRRRPIAQSQPSKQQSVKIPATTTSHHQSIKVPTTNQSQMQPVNTGNNSANLNPSSIPVVSQHSPYESIQSQLQSPVILPPTKENSLNIYNALSSQPVSEQLQPIAASSINSFNTAASQYPINQAMGQQTSQLFNSLSPQQTLTGQNIAQLNQTMQQALQLAQNSPMNRPNNSLKQLQLQFLLDCALLDPLTKTKIPLGTNPVGDDFFFTPMPYINQYPQPAPVNLKQIPFNPFNPQSFLPSFPSLFPTTPPPITTVVLTDSTTQTTQAPVYVSIPTRRPKKKVKNVYVDLPIVSEVGNMLDKMYNFMEESLVTKVVKKTETQPSRRGPSSQTAQTPAPQIVQVVPSNQIVPLSAIDGSDDDYYERYTTPYYRTTRSRRQRPKRRRRPIASTYYTNRLPSNHWQPISFHRQKRTTLVPNYGNKVNSNKNYLTTKIHVTSEYSGPPDPPHPTERIDYQDGKKVTKSPEDDEDEDDYYDSFALPEMNFDSGTYDDDDDDDDIDDDDNGSESAQENKSNLKKQPKKKIRKNSKKVDSGSSESDSYEDDDDSGGGYYTPSMGMFGDFFGNMASSVNKYVPSFGGSIPFFGNYFRGGSGSKDMDYNGIEERSTTPKIETRNPKNPKYIFSDYNDYNAIDSPDGNVASGGSWYNPFSSSNEATATTTDTTEASNEYWHWFGNSNENTESASENSATSQNNSGNYNFNYSKAFILVTHRKKYPKPSNILAVFVNRENS